MKMGPHDQVVGAWADAPSGPGWSNRLIWVCVRDAMDGRHRVDCFQPEEQTAEMMEIFDFALVASSRLDGAVRRALDKSGVAAARRRKG